MPSDRISNEVMNLVADRAADCLRRACAVAVGHASGAATFLDSYQNRTGAAPRNHVNNNGDFIAPLDPAPFLRPIFPDSLFVDALSGARVTVNTRLGDIETSWTGAVLITRFENGIGDFDLSIDEDIVIYSFTGRAPLAPDLLDFLREGLKIGLTNPSYRCFFN